MSIADVWIVTNASRTRSAGCVGRTLFFRLGGDATGVLAGLPAWAGLCGAALFGGACPRLTILRVFAIAVGCASARAAPCTLEVGAGFTCRTGQPDGGVALSCDTPATCKTGYSNSPCCRYMCHRHNGLKPDRIAFQGLCNPNCCLRNLRNGCCDKRPQEAYNRRLWRTLPAQFGNAPKQHHRFVRLSK